MNFVPQQKIEINFLIKMNCIISRNNDKNLFTVENGKEKGKEKIEENQTIQVNSEKKLKKIKLNFHPIQNNSQKNKNMSTGRPSNFSVSTHDEKSQQIMQQRSTQLRKHVYIGRCIIDNESTHKDKNHHRSTPIKRTDWASRHMNSNVSTYKNKKV